LTKGCDAPLLCWHSYDGTQCVFCAPGCRQLLQTVDGRAPTFGDNALVVTRYVQSAVDVIRTCFVQADVDTVHDPVS